MVIIKLAIGKESEGFNQDKLFSRETMEGTFFLDKLKIN